MTELETKNETPSNEMIVESFIRRASEHAPAMTARQLDQGWQRVRASLASEPSDTQSAKGRATGRRWFWGVPAAAACGLLILVALQSTWLGGGEKPLGYRADHLESHDGAFASADQGDAGLHFSDGSAVVFAARTRMALDHVAARGAQLRLVDGSVDVDVRPRKGNAWSFLAGRFRVNVKGTAFRLAYAAADGRMSLHMQHGHVEVLAPGARVFPLGDGQSLELLDPPADSSAEPLPSSAGAAVVAPVARAADKAPKVGDRAGADSAYARNTLRRAARPGERDDQNPWAQRMSQGDFAAVVADAQKRNVDDVIAHADATDLSYLADAARYTRRYDLARQVLLAMRSRFAGSRTSSDASFFLGRLAEAAPDTANRAFDWYETYLREAPRGSYAAEALGRQMTLLSSRDSRAASKLARLYIERFPRGAQIELARSLISAEPE